MTVISHAIGIPISFIFKADEKNSVNGTHPAPVSVTRSTSGC